MSLPHNIEAEQALLGALMFDNSVLERLPVVLESDDFYDPVHGRIYAAIAGRIRAGALADGVVLKEMFARDGGIQEIGGAVYLIKLMEAAAPLTAQAQSYALLIRDLRARRDIYRICQETARKALNGDGDADAEGMANEAERALQRVVGAGGANDIGLQDAGVRVVENLSRPYRGLSTGIYELDKLIGGLLAPDLIVLAARPAMGKTSLAVNIAYNVASGSVVDRDGQVIRPRVVAFFSMEMSADQLAGRALSRSSKSHGALAFTHSSLNASEYRPRSDDVAPLLLRLPQSLRIDDGGRRSVAHMRAVCRDIRSRYGALDLVCVDYLQLAVDPSARKDGRVVELGGITADLKGLAKDMSVPVVALSQLSRAVENRIDKTPQLSDLRESGSIEQDADTVVFIYREHYYLVQNEPHPRENEDDSDFGRRKRDWAQRKLETKNIMSAICGKRRNGPVGVTELRCDLAHDIVSDPEPGNNGPPARRQHWMDD